jgi:hypothetical protein
MHSRWSEVWERKERWTLDSALDGYRFSSESMYNCLQDTYRCAGVIKRFIDNSRCHEAKSYGQSLRPGMQMRNASRFAKQRSLSLRAEAGRSALVNTSDLAYSSIDTTKTQDTLLIFNYYNI